MTYEELTAAALFLAEVDYKSARNAKRDHVSTEWIEAARDDAYQAWEVYGDQVTCKTGFTIERGGLVEDVSGFPGIMARLDRQFPAAAAVRLASKAGCTVVWDKQSEPLSPVRDGTNCRHRGDGVVKLADGREYRFNAYDFGRGADFILRYLTNAGGAYSAKRGHEIPLKSLPAVRAAVSAAIAVELAKISKARREAFLTKEAAKSEEPPAARVVAGNWRELGQTGWIVPDDGNMTPGYVELNFGDNKRGSFPAEDLRFAGGPHDGQTVPEWPETLALPLETISGEPLGSDADNAAHREAGTQVKRPAGTIDLSPSWRAAVEVYVIALEDGAEHGRRIAREELRRMAGLLDSALTVVKAADEACDVLAHGSGMPNEKARGGANLILSSALSAFNSRKA